MACLTDLLLNCGAILFVTTIYSRYPGLLNLLLIVPAALIWLTSPQKRPEKIRTPQSNKGGKDVPKGLDPLPVRPFITTYRGTMLVITAVAILAVDFKVFPRRFAKVETWGTSLMDMGVGSFVFSAGLMAARPILREQVSGKQVSIIDRFTSSLRHALPLLVLGLVRLWSVKELDYNEHVTEYGVHWNFFFTLGLLPPFMALSQVLFRFIPSHALQAALLGVGYQIALDSTDLTAYILSAPRDNLLSKNREGVFSFIGYLSIFLAGTSSGMRILKRPKVLPDGASGTQRFRNTALGYLVISATIRIIMYLAATDYRYGAGLQVSRRLANLPYIVWVAAFNTAQLAAFAAIEALCFPNVLNTKDPAQERSRATEATSRVLRAFNRNGLALFLAANLLTGLVNMVLPTLHMSDLQAMGVLCAYIGILAAMALGLDELDVTLKI